jgi:hypothetical protein
MAFRTEFRFKLPRGFVDKDGKAHRDGVMRLATARDEILPLQDYRVQANRAYLVIVLLSRVITKLGEIDHVGVDTIENLFSTDLAYLQEFYRKINEEGAPNLHLACPKCSHEFDVDMLSGGVIGPEGTVEGGAGRSGQG